MLALIVGATVGRAQGARGIISGVVIGPAGAPQPNVTLILTNAAGIDRRGVSEADGQFVFGGLQPGTYRLRTDDETFAPFSQDQVVVPAGQTLTIRIALQSRVPVAPAPTARATVQGTVIGPNGLPLGGAVLVLTNPQGIDRRGVSEASGAYVFGGLQPGTYRLRIEEPVAGAQPFPRSRPPARARGTASVRCSTAAGSDPPRHPLLAPSRRPPGGPARRRRGGGARGAPVASAAKPAGAGPEGHGRNR